MVLVETVESSRSRLLPHLRGSEVGTVSLLLWPGSYIGVWWAQPRLLPWAGRGQCSAPTGDMRRCWHPGYRQEAPHPGAPDPCRGAKSDSQAEGGLSQARQHSALNTACPHVLLHRRRLLRETKVSDTLRGFGPCTSLPVSSAGHAECTWPK